MSAQPAASPALSNGSDPTGPAPPSYRIPALGWRILGGGVRFVMIVVLLTIIPIGVIGVVGDHGIQPPIPLATVELFGVLLALLVSLRYILKPTVAYGPLAIATAGVTLAYLYLLFVTASYAIAIPHTDATFSVDYTRLILILMIGPALAATAGLLTVVEDLAHPRERLAFDYPA